MAEAVNTTVVVRGAAHKRALDQVLQDKVAQAKSICQALKGCRIVIDTIRRRHMPKRFDVKILCHVSKVKRDVIVSSQNKPHLSIAVAEAFSKLHKRLSSHGERLKPAYWRHRRGRDSALDES